MQTTIAIILAVLLIINLILFFKLKDSTKINITKALGNTELTMSGVMISEIVLLFSKDRQIAYFAYTYFYISFAWFLLTVFRFSMAYSGYGNVKILKVPLFWIVLLETYALIWGTMDESFFTITHVKWYDHIYWISRRFPIFNIYALISAVTLTAAVFVLLKAAKESARIYRLRYTGVVITIIIMILSAAISQINEQPIMFQVILIALCQMAVIYVTQQYAPRRLNNKVLWFVADKLNDGIVVYDDEHRLQLVTSGFSDVFGLKGMQGIGDEEAYWAEKFAQAYEENAWNGRVIAVDREERREYYEMKHMALREEEKTIGTVYWILNVTESITNYRNMVLRANFDELTGLYNEVHFHESAKQLLLDNPDKTFVMICSSVMKFRLFMELFGREKVEDFLRLSAKTVINGVADIPVCRYGKIGESEFYLMLPKDQFVEQELLEKIDSVTSKFSIGNFNLEVKVGVYEITEPPYNMLAICNMALMACETIKGDYSRRILWANEDIQKELRKKEQYNAELTKAIAHGEIQIYLQPQIDNDNRVAGAEALVRWIHREDGFIVPALFVPFFELNGRITELDICVWRQACEKLKEWKDKGREDLYISVNISAKDIYAIDIYEHFTKLINEYGISPANLKLEITESAIIDNLEQHIHLIEKLQNAGFEIEMDDFGSAYSSFNMLKDICVNVLKIDMKFLGNTENEERSQIILKSIIDLSRELRMKTVAEGVETQSQLDYLKSVGCDIYQGYHFAKPMSVADFEKSYL